MQRKHFQIWHAIRSFKVYTALWKTEICNYNNDTVHLLKHP